MKKEKKLFELPSLSTLEGKNLNLNDLEDLEDEFGCGNGCESGCSTGTGIGYKGDPGGECD